MPTPAPQSVSQHTIDNLGILIYLMITQPDLNYPVGLLSQFMQTPRDIHLDCAKRLLRYVSGTMDYVILYKLATPIRLKRYTDADWADYNVDRQSTSGFFFSLDSGAIWWGLEKQYGLRGYLRIWVPPSTIQSCSTTTISVVSILLETLSFTLGKSTLRCITTSSENMSL